MLRLPVSEVVYRLRAMIRSREMMPGEKLGSERGLAAELGISRSELRIALAELESSHEIIRKIGRAGGIVVADGKLERNLNTLESLPEIARRQGWTLESRVVSAAIAPASPADVRLLRLEGEAPMVIGITRLRSLGGQPLSLETTSLPGALFPGFLTRDLTRSFYETFDRDYNVRPKAVDETVESITAGEREAAMLSVAPGTALLRLHRVAYGEDGVPCERATDVYIADRIRFTMHHSGYVRLSATRR